MGWQSSQKDWKHLVFMQQYFKYRNAWRFDGPPDEEEKLDAKSWREILRKGGLFVRNTYGFDGEESNFWYVIKDHFEEIENLKPRTRTKIRAALKTFDYKLVDFETIKEKGYSIITETYTDYKVADRKMNKAIFTKYLDDCQNRSFDFWGVFDKSSKELVGFYAVRIWKDCCEYDQSALKTKYKHGSSYPYYGLYYVMNQYYIDNLHFKYVSDGSRTITEHSQIHDFLIQHFGFRKAYCQLEVHYQWWMKMAVNLLYPFRNIIKSPRVKAVLNMEAMRRGEK